MIKPHLNPKYFAKISIQISKGCSYKKEKKKSQGGGTGF
jgi:hypothetical protein